MTPTDSTRLDDFLDYWTKIRHRTVRVARCIPDDSVDWTYREGKFTFGDLVRHLAAIERHMFAENAAGRVSRYPGHGAELSEPYGPGLAGVLAYAEAMHREALEVFRSLGDARLQERCETPGGASLPVWKWLRAMVEHEVHHRGQIYLYLGILGVETPPLYGLTAEEVEARSRPGR